MITSHNFVYKSKICQLGMQKIYIKLQKITHVTQNEVLVKNVSLTQLCTNLFIKCKYVYLATLQKIRT